MAGVTPHARAAESLRELPNLINDDPDFIQCVESLHSGNGATFDSVWGSACALLTAALTRRFAHLMIVFPDSQSLDNHLDDLETFSDGPARRFPLFQPSPDTSAQVDQDYGERLRVLKDCINGNPPPVIGTSVQSLLQSVPSKASILDHTRVIRRGEVIDLESFHSWLLQHGFHQTSSVELPGEYSARGGIIDLFAPDWSYPVRIELFDNEVESIRNFSIGSQRSHAEQEKVEITVLSPAHHDSVQLIDHLPKETLILLVEPEELNENANSFIERSERPFELLGWAEVQKHWARRPIATASRLTTGYLGAQWKMPAETVEAFSGDISEIRMQVDRFTANGQFYAVARVDGEIARVTEILSTTETAVAGRLNISVGCVHQGFRWRKPATMVVGCDQLFHRTDVRRTRSRHRRLGKAIDSFLDLRYGDLVVHLSHGISRFRGLKMLDKDGQHTEHLELEFHGGTKIYVPASKIDLVQKYIGGTKTSPTLARIGGKAWVRQRQAAERAVEDLASEMIELQAARSGRPGLSFHQETQWQSEFEQSFPYRETEDQVTAIDAIKQDMQRARPMDRLLCGDVGYGKTEVAMRAAFKAVENGYQVAVLVPTTILAEQHFRTFSERMGEFPLEIAKLSRFCSTRELRETVEKLKTGQVDIAIGTHRLVSKDVEFYNLGLVIIDEEQRFGVAHKERLKSLRSTVDVLTMSATPIPRTLHMSLVGVRDISNLETPPDERVAVETKVTRFDADLIRSAILRELNRGGQTFFVHNRVSDIQHIKQQLEAIVPEASICVGHGQMHEEDLEQVMSDFINGRYDILLATTIIESGLDIPNANTIFIDHADHFGLSDLHQLRGRVGRYKNRAYCYMLLEPHKHLTPVAAKRLQAIETFSDMGAGFAISMRDLEIRGAGNLLGTEQSGHIAAVGYELYCQLLETAVRQLKKEPAKISLNVDIDLPLEAYIPDSYVSDGRQKIDLYRRLTRLERFDQIQLFRDELQDRFGKIPSPTRRLLNLCELKLEAAVWQIQSIFIQTKYLGFRYENKGRIQQLAKMKKGIIRIVDDKTAFVTLKTARIEPDKMIRLVKSLLQVDS